MKPDTIAAIATPPGQGGIGIVRLSGPQALAIATRLFRPRVPRPGPYPSHRLLLGQIIAPDDGQVIDEVLLSYMQAPHSYTREDVVEINCHSGWAVLQQILNLVLQHGARLAEPGEFTQRAFLSGRLDLTQAEAVLEVIQARSAASLKVAAGHLSGGLGQTIARHRQAILDLLALVEADLDFGEEVPALDYQQLLPALQDLSREIETLATSYGQGRIWREGLQVVLAGRPNVGKSSLLNRLLQTDRALVTDIPGTTRDVIAEQVVINGLPVCLLDTAGLRQTEDTVEVLGVARTRQHLAQADLVLYLIDASQPWQPEDTVQLESLAGQKILLLLNKCDLPMVLSPEALALLWPHQVVVLSALTGAGIPELRQAIVQAAMDQALQPSGQMVTQARHYQHLRQCQDYLSQTQNLIAAAAPPELLACDLRAAAQELGAILGLEIGEEVLDRIFSQFCLGK
ncbi:MAG: tRNA uridine-5-carboxymethylaminomethyl(34) synthesis GTPase MnmE [Desulfobacca sp.]|uniref:tRNA uridine-5-carboxymethylaminomethyl(34) synthesis GTPase MnmE n=1 Tax=Desulfobacca sp. TaxID=2067990 RepID=UPI00404A93B8